MKAEKGINEYLHTWLARSIPVTLFGKMIFVDSTENSRLLIIQINSKVIFSKLNSDIQVELSI